jgi:hypothetical protein
MERPDQGSPLPSDPAGREDIMSDEQAGRENVNPDEPDVKPDRPGARPDAPEDGRVRAAAAGDSPLPSDPGRHEDVIRDDMIRDTRQT